jgi:tetratricopeptide (TPR) repeat protein
MTHPNLAAALQALQKDDMATAEALVRACLAGQPDNAEALRLLARIAVRTGFATDAEQLLRQALAVAPMFIETHVDLTSLLCRLSRPEEAVALLDLAIARQPDAIWPLSLKVAVLDAERRTEEALPLHETLVGRAPHVAAPWLNYGHALQAIGRVDDAVAAYRMSLRIDPGNGFAWLGLTGLRPDRLGPDDIASLERALSDCDDVLQHAQLHFALGRALGDCGRFAESFRHYESGNRLRRELAPYDAAATNDFVERAEAIFTPELLARNAGRDCDAPDPIFIIGMPRAGSTLVEQILASHPMIEGCGELFEMPNIAADLGNAPSPRSTWPKALAKLGADELQALGRRYLAAVRRHRRAGRPLFTDKMPSNWQHLGLIHLILPNARIIDVRRHPLPCCFSAFTTYFSRETSFPTTLEELGRYHTAYVRMVEHFEALLPGKIHRVQFGDLLAHPEREVSRLLDYLGLPFDAACLRFHENPRAVHTPSAQQVRRPINSDGQNRWRNYEPWLDALKDVLGPICEPCP